jgi:predicted nucleic-acid-binding Zn-ribbon protein
MSQTKTCPKCGGVMKLKDEIQEGDSVSKVTPLDRTWTCDCGHMEIEARPSG